MAMKLEMKFLKKSLRLPIQARHGKVDLVTQYGRDEFAFVLTSPQIDLIYISLPFLLGFFRPYPLKRGRFLSIINASVV